MPRHHPIYTTITNLTIWPQSPHRGDRVLQDTSVQRMQSKQANLSPASPKVDPTLNPVQVLGTLAHTPKTSISDSESPRMAASSGYIEDDKLVVVLIPASTICECHYFYDLGSFRVSGTSEQDELIERHGKEIIAIQIPASKLDIGHSFENLIAFHFFDLLEDADLTDDHEFSKTKDWLKTEAPKSFSAANGLSFRLTFPTDRMEADEAPPEGYLPLARLLL